MQLGVLVVGVLLAAGTAGARPLADTGWRVALDRNTGVPAQLVGVVDVPGSLHDAAIAERAARAFLAEHVDELAPGARADDFVLVANRLDGDLRTVGFAQTSGGVPVIGGQLGFVFGRDRLFAIMSTAFPRVAVTRSKTTQAILPVVERGGVRYHAVTIRDVRGKGAHWHVYVDAAGNEVGRKSLVMTDSATLTYSAGVRYGAGARAAYPAAHVALTVDGSAATTDAAGAFTWTGATTASVVPRLTGTYVTVSNSGGPTATTTLTAQAGATLNWDLAADPLGDAQVSAYVYAGIAKARARIVSPSATAWIDRPLSVTVNESFSRCNAYSTGDDLHFLVGSPGVCENAARIADVVFHEFGHSLHNQSVILGVGAWESALSEGLADFYAALIVEDHGTGRGFLLTDEPLRDIDPVGIEYRYPEDVAQDPHMTGLIISGALWDLRTQLVAKLGATAGTAATERILAGLMARAPHIPGSYMAALIADDNDANLTNGTPHICEINVAFAAHGLYQDITPVPLGPATLEGLSLTVPIQATAACLAATRIDVTWKSSAGASGSFALAPQGNTWSGMFPEQPDHSVLSYSIVATLANGTTRALPDNPADPMYQQYIGTVKPLWCTNMDQDPMWRRASAQMTTAWQWDRPRGGVDPASAHTGTNVLGTVLIGDGRYAANEFAYVETPSMDLSPYHDVHLQYWRWLTVQDGAVDQATITARPDEVVATGQTTTLWQNANAPSHIDREWRFHDVDLSTLASTGPFHLRWVLKSDSGNELGGWSIDDVCVVTADPSVCGDHEISETEECDDGNRDDGDGCSKLCQLEGGGCCSATSDPLGPLALAALLGVRLRRRPT